MVVGAHLEVAAVLALVAVGIHVADDGVLDLADGVGKQRHRPDTDHLVHRGTERDRGPRHAGETRLQMPLVMTTVSVSMSPLSVRTRRTRPFSTSMPVTSVLATTVRAPIA